MDWAPSNQLRMVQLNTAPTEHIWDSILHWSNQCISYYEFFLQQPSGKPKCLPSSHTELHYKGYKGLFDDPFLKILRNKEQHSFQILL